MKKWLKLLFGLVLFLSLAETASAQGSFFTGNAYRYTPAGIFAASRAAVTVCTSAGLLSPCTPKISLFADAALAVPVANPLPVCTTSPQFGCIDGLGNFSFYATTTGPYVYTITGAGLLPYGPIPTTGSLNLGANNIFTGNNTFTGAATFSGSLDSTNPSGGLIRLSSALDAGIERLAPDVIGFGNGTANDISAEIRAGKVTSTVAIGTPPLTVTSTTQVANLDASLLNSLTPPPNGITLLNAQANAAAITGTGAAATVYTYTLPANAVGTLKGIRVTVAAVHGTGAAAVLYQLTLNGVLFFSLSNNTSNLWTSQFSVLNTGATTGTLGMVQAPAIGGTTAGLLTGLAWTSPQVLTLTFNVANTDQVTPIQWLVELIQ